jgi:hypothetical protein
MIVRNTNTINQHHRNMINQNCQVNRVIRVFRRRRKRFVCLLVFLIFLFEIYNWSCCCRRKKKSNQNGNGGRRRKSMMVQNGSFYNMPVQCLHHRMSHYPQVYTLNMMVCCYCDVVVVFFI